MNKHIRRECQLFLLSISIFTRLPVPSTLPYSEERKNESYKYCGLVGLVIGGLTAFVFTISNLFWLENVAVVISMIFSVYITGAFHEDGLADTVDGLGGGFTTERKLEIMKDSRVGAYGVLSLVLILLLKYTLLLSTASICSMLIIGHVLSRTVAVSFVYTHCYVRQTQESKLNIATGTNNVSDFFTMIAVAFFCSIFFLSVYDLMIVVVILLLLRWRVGLWIKSQIGGYTGDVLGAIQQMFEIVCYLVMITMTM